MKRRPDVTCIGEALIDFVSMGPDSTLTESAAFQKALGGEAANVAVGLAKLGTRTAFIGKVGDDPFGEFLVSELADAGVDVNGVRCGTDLRTRLAFICQIRSGDREFEFWEEHPAGEQLRFSEINPVAISSSMIVHVGSLLLLREPSRTAAIRVAEKVRNRNGCTSFDANLRLSLWRSSSEARRVFLRMVRSSSILRLNEDEARFLTGKRRVESTARALLDEGPKIVFVTLGQRGCYVQTGNESVYARGFKVGTVDTTGCGDAFFAGVLHAMAQVNGPPELLQRKELFSMCQFANAVGALTATKPGAAAAMPTGRQVNVFLRQHSADEP